MTIPLFVVAFRLVFVGFLIGFSLLNNLALIGAVEIHVEIHVDSSRSLLTMPKECANRFSRCSLGRKDCPMSQKSVCKVGYKFFHGIKI